MAVRRVIVLSDARHSMYEFFKDRPHPPRSLTERSKRVSIIEHGGGRQNVWQSRIREIRKQRGLTQEQLAYRSGLSLATIRRLEVGYRSNPFFGTVEKLAAVLGVPVDDLL